MKQIMLGYQAGKRDYRGNDGSNNIASDYQSRDDRNASKRVKTNIGVSESPPFPFALPNNNSNNNLLPNNNTDNFQFNTYPQQDYNYYYYYNQPNQTFPSPVNYFTPPPPMQPVFPLTGVYTIPLTVQSNVNLPQNTQTIKNTELPAKSKTPPPKQKKKNKLKKQKFKNLSKKQSEYESKVILEPVNNVTTKEHESTFMQYLAQNFTDMQIKIFQLHHQRRTELVTNK